MTEFPTVIVAGAVVAFSIIRSAPAEGGGGGGMGGNGVKTVIVTGLDVDKPVPITALYTPGVW